MQRTTRGAAAASAAGPSPEARARLQGLFSRVVAASESNALALEGTGGHGALVDARCAAGKVMLDNLPAPAELGLCVEWLKERAECLNLALSHNPEKTVVVYCDLGKSRSPAVVLAWLKRYHGVEQAELKLALDELGVRCRMAGQYQTMTTDKWEVALSCVEPA